MTGMFFSAASRRMRVAIRADCTGDPPGELIASATALAPLVPKALFSSEETASRERPRAPNRLPAAITPERRTTGTMGVRRRRFVIQLNMPGTVAARGWKASVVLPASDTEEKGMKR